MTAAAEGAGARRPLDEVMLAMDVVDTLRRRERLVASELEEGARREALKARLKRLYAAQGIDVPDRILEEGVEALARDRFAFRPPPRTLQVRLAEIYVSRARWGRWALGGVAALAAAGALWWMLAVAPDAALADDLRETAAAVAEVARDGAAREAAAEALDAGEAALARDDADAARASLAVLERLRERLEAAYVLRIVNRPGGDTGVWRIPDVNESARNHYIVVEALDDAGRPVEVPVRNEETGRTERVSTWAVRVPEAVFDAVARDKRDDGIVQNAEFGRKRRGVLEPDYAFETSGAAITAW